MVPPQSANVLHCVQLVPEQIVLGAIVLQYASPPTAPSMHSWQRPSTPHFGVVPAHWASLRHELAHTWLTQKGLPPPQSPFTLHSTQTLFGVSHLGVVPVHAV